MHEEGLVVRQGSGIHTLSGLAGKKVATVMGSTSPYVLTTALRSRGISPSRVTLVNMGPQSMTKAWSKGEIYAAYTWSPWLNMMQHQHGRILMYDSQVAQRAPVFNLVVANSSWAKTHTALVTDFLKADMAGYTFYRQHPSAGLSLMAKYSGTSLGITKTLMAGYRMLETPTAQLKSTGLGSGASVGHSLVAKSLKASAKYLYSSGSISVAPPASMVNYINSNYARLLEKSLKR